MWPEAPALFDFRLLKWVIAGFQERKIRLNLISERERPPKQLGELIEG